MRFLAPFVLCSTIFSVLAFQPGVSNIVFRGGVGASSRRLDGAFFHKPSLTSGIFSSDQTTAIAFSPASSSSADSGEEWTEKRLHNTQWFRSAAILLALGLAGASQKSPLAMIPTRAGAAINLFSFGTSFGTMFYTTFIFGITAFKNLPRQTFGKLQSKLFPKYFSLCSATMLLQILTLRSLPLEISKSVIWSLGSALSATLLNQFMLEPYSTKIMLERYDIENTKGGLETERYKELKASFGKMHGISSLSNLIALCGQVAYGFILSSVLLA